MPRISRPKVSFQKKKKIDIFFFFAWKELNSEKNHPISLKRHGNFETV